MAVDASVVAVVREFGRLDVVLESAKIRHRLKFFLDVSAEISDRIIAATLTGLFHLGQEATRKMVRQGGGVNVTLQFAVAVVLTNLQDRDCIEALTPGK